MRLIRNPDLISSEIDGEVVMMSIEDGSYFAIGGVGGRVWELLNSPVSIEEIVTKLTTEFDIDEQSCRRDVVNFIQSLLKDGVVREAQTLP